MVSGENDTFLLPVASRMSLSVFAMKNIGTPAKLPDCGVFQEMGLLWDRHRFTGSHIAKHRFSHRETFRGK